MPCKKEWDRTAVRDLDQFDPHAARRTVAGLHGRVAELDAPRSLGEALRGSPRGEFCKHGVGDGRIIGRLEHQMLRTLIVKIGNRRDVYR